MDGSIVAMSEIGLKSTTSPLKPIFIATKSMDHKREAEEAQVVIEEVEEDEFPTTPTSAESRIPTKLTCPPAPKKRKPTESPTCRFAGVIRYYTPPPYDLENMFKRRVPGA